MEDLNKNLKDLTNYDPHVRQNAVRFLSQKYNDDLQRKSLSENDKSRIVEGLLSRLEIAETSLEVKGCTVKNFGILSKFLLEKEIILIFSKIITYITNEKTEGRDIYVLCIKAILKEMPGKSCYTVGKTIIEEIIKGIKSKNTEIKELCFDLFNDYLNTFNYVLIKESKSVIQDKDTIVKLSVATLLENSSLRNRVAIFLGNFSLILEKDQLANLLNSLILHLTNSQDIEQKVSIINSLSNISKNTANLHGDLVNKVLNLLFQFCNRNYLESNTADYDINNNLVDCGLGLIEIYIIKLSNKMKPHVENIINFVLELIDYDPNFVYNEEEEDTINYNNYYEGYEEYEAFVFADDSSWKVRRAAVRVVSALIKSRVELPKNLIEMIINSLVVNVREHDENTKLDIISCLSLCLKNLVISDVNENSIMNNIDSFVKQKSFTNSIIPQIIQKLIDSVIKELKGKNQKIKIEIFKLLSSLAQIDANDIVIRFFDLKVYIEEALKDSSSALIAFMFLTRLLKGIRNDNTSTLLSINEINTLFDEMLKYIDIGINHDFYKINIESQNVSFHLIRLFNEYLTENDYKTKIEILYTKILPKFSSNDVDQDLKLSLICTMGNIFVYFGNLFKETLGVFKIFLEKSKNENLRPLIFSWISKIIKCNKVSNLNSSLTIFIELILELLAKQGLQTHYQTLEFLSTILNFFPDSIKGNENNLVVSLMNCQNENSSIVNLIYENLTTIFKNFKISTDLVEKSLMSTLSFIEKENEQVTSIFNFFEVTGRIVENKKINEIVKNLIDAKNFANPINYNQAKSISILSNAAGIDKSIIDTLLEKLNNNKNSESLNKNILLCLGELSLLSEYKSDELLVNLGKMLGKVNEILITSLAECIGKIGAHDSEDFIKFISKDKNKENLYSHLISIREYIKIIKTKNVKNTQTKEILNMINNNRNNEDEKIRILCGENLGYISLHDEDKFVDFIKNIKNSNPVIRATIYLSLRVILKSKDKMIDNHLDKIFNAIMEGLVDTDIFVKQNSFSSLINLVQSYGTLIKTRFSELFPIFQIEYILNPKLIETVDLGAGIKVKNDKGLPIRKALYTCIRVLLDTMPEKINILETLNMLLYALGNDEEEVISLCHECILKITKIAPEAFISILDTLLERLKKKYEIFKKKNSDGKFDNKKLGDLVGNIIRLFEELKKVKEIDENPNFISFHDEVKNLNI